MDGGEGTGASMLQHPRLTHPAATIRGLVLWLNQVIVLSWVTVLPLPPSTNLLIKAQYICSARQKALILLIECYSRSAEVSWRKTGISLIWEIVFSLSSESQASHLPTLLLAPCQSLSADWKQPSQAECNHPKSEAQSSNVLRLRLLGCAFTISIPCWQGVPHTATADGIWVTAKAGHGQIDRAEMGQMERSESPDMVQVQIFPLSV